jgi:NAD(P)-dependent dehydrogenase (short-subunit alcohol dehydrogenase family)
MATAKGKTSRRERVDFSLKGKVALITGGGRGIGRATALRFASAGADVVVASRGLPELERVAEEIRGVGRKSLAVAADIRRMEDITNLVTRVKEEFGRIDILVNNAGVWPALQPALDVEEPVWDMVINLHLKGLYFLSQAAVRVMISKAGIIMATKVMALEWAQYNIRVNAVAPGVVYTRFSEAGLKAPRVEEMVIQRTPLGRIADPGDIVGAMIFLASDASSFATGATVVLDGGRLLT